MAATYTLTCHTCHAGRLSDTPTGKCQRCGQPVTLPPTKAAATKRAAHAA